MTLHLLQVIFFGLLIANGVRVTIGIPPISYWFRSRVCPLCEGVGYLRAHTHTGEVVDVPVADVLEAKRDKA